MKIAILGFGTVGRAVARLIHTHHRDRLTITHVFNRDPARKQRGTGGLLPAHVVWTAEIETVLAARPDVVVELLGGVTPAAAHVRRALLAGSSVVTANKQVVAYHGAELMAIADAHGAELRFDGAVAGGVPVLRAIEDGLSADRLTKVAGVVNGTSTHILSRMESGETFAAALAEAQALGFAEADPGDDLNGRDAAAKLAILSATALGRPIPCNDITCRSIVALDPLDFRYAGELGCTIRQVAWAEAGTGPKHVVAAVRPALVPRGSALASIRGNQNVVTVTGQFGGETAFVGPGAGGDATAVAVVSDLLAIAAAPSGAHPRPRHAFAVERCSVSADYEAPHYVRFTVRDRPGIVAAVSSAFAREHVSINAVLQHPGWPASRLPFVMTIEPCDEQRLDRAISEISQLDFNVEPPIVLPILGVAAAAHAA